MVAPYHGVNCQEIPAAGCSVNRAPELRDTGAVVRLNAVTSRDRHRVVQDVHHALLTAGVTVTDFHQFSNVSISLTIEAGYSAAKELQAALAASGLLLSRSSTAELDCALSAVEPGHTLVGTIQITFFHEEPDLRIPTPAVPG